MRRFFLMNDNIRVYIGFNLMPLKFLWSYFVTVFFFPEMGDRRRGITTKEVDVNVFSHSAVSRLRDIVSAA